VLAPGDGEAEPGEPNPITSQPTKWATDETLQSPGFIRRILRLMCRLLCRLVEIGALPQARLRHRLGL